MDKELEERLKIIEEKLNRSKEEFDELTTVLVKVLQFHEDSIRDNRTAINEIYDYLNERDKVTFKKVLGGLTSTRSLFGI